MKEPAKAGDGGEAKDHRVIESDGSCHDWMTGPEAAGGFVVGQSATVRANLCLRHGGETGVVHQVCPGGNWPLCVRFSDGDSVNYAASDLVLPAEPTNPLAEPGRDLEAQLIAALRKMGTTGDLFSPEVLNGFRWLADELAR